MTNLIPFLSYVFVTAFTPGPNNIMAMTNANRYGFKNSIPFNFGVFAGFVPLMLLCAYFDLVLVSLLPKIQLLLELLAAAYMLYLAYKVIRSSVDAESTGPGKPISFLSGMLLQFANPKVILYGITVISTYIIPYNRDHPTLVLTSVFLSFVGFTGTLCWALFGAMFQKLLNKYQKPFNIAMALLLVYCAVSVF